MVKKTQDERVECDLYTGISNCPLPSDFQNDVKKFVLCPMQSASESWEVALAFACPDKEYPGLIIEYKKNVAVTIKKRNMQKFSVCSEAEWLLLRSEDIHCLKRII